LVGPELLLGKIFDEIGFNQIEDTLFRDLVITRIVYPASTSVFPMVQDRINLHSSCSGGPWEVLLRAWAGCIDHI
jgi:hypothetical protein